MEPTCWSPRDDTLAPPITSDQHGDGSTQDLHPIADDEVIPLVSEARPGVANSPRKPVGKWAIELPRLLVSTNLTLEKFHALKWREIATFSRLVAAPCFRRVRLAGDDHALYECFYRSFPHELVTKARFVGVTRAVLGVDEDAGVKSRLSSEQLDLCRHLEKMQYAFELSSENVPMLNWRLLLVGLHLFQHPLASLRDHLSWGFRVFGSNGFLNALADATAIATSDAALLITQLVRNQACMRLVADRFRQAQVLMPTGTLTPANVRQRMTATRMTHRRFQELLALAPLRALFDKATDHTTCLEEMATPLYRERVFRARKKAADRKKIERLRYFHRTKRLRRAFFLWSENARVRRRTRQLMVVAMERIARVQRAHAFARVKRHAIHCWAATEIQRMARGLRGRRIALDQWTLVQAAVKVQGAFRMRSHFVRFLQDLRRRNRAAIRIQRVYRGRAGRIVARTTLLAFYYAELEQIQRERDAFRARVRCDLARRLQRLFRAVVAKKRVARAAREARERERVELEMLENATSATMLVRRHKRDVTAKYNAMREAFEYKQRRKQIDGVEKGKVIRLRRQRQWDAFKHERVQVRERYKREAAAAYDALKATWDAAISDRVKRQRLFVAQVLELEQPGEWKPLQKQLRALVAECERLLLAKYKESKVAVPKSEVRDRAKIEVVDGEVEKERHAAEAEWFQAEADFLNQLEEQAEARSLEDGAAERRRREKSAVLVQSAFRMFAARQQLKREIRACFVKEFDVATQLAMYRNALAGEPRSARKPYGLGSDDLEFADQWVLIADDVVGHPFFFNPKRIVQSWEKPDECQGCNACAAAVPSKIAFAAYWNARDDSYLCQACFDGRRQSAAAGGSEEFHADEYYPYDGSKKGGY